MNHLALVIKREYLAKIKNKSFVIMTFLTPLIMVGITSLIVFLTQLNNDTERTISILDESGLVSDLFANNKQITYNIMEGLSLDEAQLIVESQEHYGLLYVKAAPNLEALAEEIKFISKESPSISIITSIEQRLEKRISELKLKRLGVDLKKIQDSKTRVDIYQESFEGVRTSKSTNFMKIIFGLFSGYLLFLFVVIYGSMIMRSVIEEKTSRIIEVIISSVKPIQLMMGKIVGTSLVAISQYTVWVILIFILSTLSLIFMGIDMEQVTSQQQVIQNSANSAALGEVQLILSEFFALPLFNLLFTFLLYFIFGFLLYSSLYAAIGAAVDNETDSQQFMLPVLIPLMIAMYVGAFTVIEDPHGTVSTVFSHIPFTSPVVMLMRIPFGVPVWEQCLSILILICTFMGTVWVASKIYRVGILMYGKKPSYKELYKWLKY